MSVSEKSQACVVLTVDLVRKVGNLNTAGFLTQCAFLSSISTKKGGWFDLPQEGECSNDPNANFFQRLGSFRSCLGISADEQATIRKKLRSEFPGVLHEKKKGIPARLHYYVDQAAYQSLGGAVFGKTEKRADQKADGASEVADASACPHQQIIALYHDMLPVLSRVQKSRWIGSDAARDLAARWQEGLEAGKDGVDLSAFAFQTREQGMEAMRLFFGLVKESPLLLGEVPSRNGNRPFIASLRWLVKRENFDKTLQGNYVNRGVARHDDHGAYAERKPSRLGLKPGETYDRFADYASRGEFAEDPSEKDKRILLFDGGVYLFGEQIVLLDKTDKDLVREAIAEFAPFGQVARVPLDKLPKRVEITRRCRLNGLVNDSPDIPIKPHEMPVFGPYEEASETA